MIYIILFRDLHHFTRYFLWLSLYKLTNQIDIMRKLITICFAAFFIVACGGNSGDNASGDADKTTADAATEKSSSDYDPNRGEGKFTEVKLGDQLDAAMALRGKNISDLKCTSCHKLTDEKLVGPGWAGVTKRHQPQWIMNFITNPDPMIDKDPKIQAMLEICLVRMPNQNVSDADARDLLEFMRENDGVK